MGIFLTCILIGISLSMDAFSLALIYGTMGLSFKIQVIISVVVGLFHFFMPLLGLELGNYLMNYFIINSNLMVGVIFGIIGVEMLISDQKESGVKLFNHFLGYLLFGFTVSIDSLTTGIGLSLITKNYIVAAIIFMVISSIFTFLGLRLGNYLKLSFGRVATVFGGGMMIVLGIYYIFRI